jgi:hypothetical protein
MTVFNRLIGIDSYLAAIVTSTSLSPQRGLLIHQFDDFLLAALMPLGGSGVRSAGSISGWHFSASASMSSFGNLPSGDQWRSSLGPVYPHRR